MILKHHQTEMSCKTLRRLREIVNYTTALKYNFLNISSLYYSLISKSLMLGDK